MKEEYTISNGSLPNENEYRPEEKDPELPYMATAAIVARNIQITGPLNE